jgi:hypothetical protein
VHRRRGRVHRSRQFADILGTELVREELLQPVVDAAGGEVRQ